MYIRYIKPPMTQSLQFADYRSYEDIETAKDLLLHILEHNSIPYEIEYTKSEMKVYTGMASWIPKVVVKIPLSSFEKANALVESNAQFITVPRNHYLVSFTDRELLDVVKNQDEWGMENYNIARKILEQRGKGVSQEQLSQYKMDRIAALSKPTNVEQVWVYAAFASAVAGGIIAIIFGRMLYTSTKILPNGKRVYLYDAESRKNGQLIYYAGVGFLLFYITIAVVTLFKSTTY